MNNTYTIDLSSRFASAGRLSDDALLARVTQLAGNEAEVTAELVAHLAELDLRRLYLARGCSSLFAYCTEVLHLSGHAAYARIEAARAARRFPRILEDLGSGALHLTAVCLLAPVLDESNHTRLLGAARHCSKRRVEELVAAERPRPDARSTVRKLPVRKSPGGTTAARPAVETSGQGDGGRPGRLFDNSDSSPSQQRPACDRATIFPTAPDRYRVQFTADAEMHSRLVRARDLLRHRVPDGDVARVLDAALLALIEKLERRKLGLSKRARSERPAESTGRRCAAGAPRASVGASRYLTADARREVWRRDRGQCAFISSDGRRCSAHGFLEFHHVEPFACGGPNVASNLSLRCRAHNGYEAERSSLGPWLVVGSGDCRAGSTRHATRDTRHATRGAGPTRRAGWADLPRSQLGPDRVRGRVRGRVTPALRPARANPALRSTHRENCRG